MKLLIALLFLSLSAFAQAPSPPTNLTAVADGQSSCSVYLVSCVSQVNGVPVCPYGRVAYYPLPGQPYTPWTYPKKDQNGNLINFFKCVSTLPPQKPWLNPNFLTAIWF